MDTYRPSWMTDELEEEWPASEHTPSPPSSGSSSSRPAPLGSLPLPQTFQAQLMPSTSLFSPSLISPLKDPEPVSSVTSVQAPGTFIVRTDMEAQGPSTPIGPLSKLKGAITPGGHQGGGGGLGIINSFFSPIALESMFEPPSPSSGSEDDHIRNANRSTSQTPELNSFQQTSSTNQSQPQTQQQRISSFDMTYPISISSSSSPAKEEIVNSFAEQPIPSSPTHSFSPSPSPSPLSRIPPSNNQLYHVPQRPSRLAKGFTPEDMTASTIDPHDMSRVEETGYDDEVKEDLIEKGDVVDVGEVERTPSADNDLKQTHVDNRHPDSFNSFNTILSLDDRSPDNGNETTLSYSSKSDEDDIETQADRPEDQIAQPTSTINPTTIASSYPNTSRTCDAKAYGPPLSPFSPFSPVKQSDVSSEPKKLQLFQPQFDTFTREFMSAIVDNINASTSTSSSSSSFGASMSSSPQPHAGSTTSSTEDVQSISILSDEVSLRSSKRIRLSPPKAEGGRIPSGSSTYSLERLRKSKSSAATINRDWDREAKEMMIRVRELDKAQVESDKELGLIEKEQKSEEKLRRENGKVSWDHESKSDLDSETKQDGEANSNDAVQESQEKSPTGEHGFAEQASKPIPASTSPSYSPKRSLASSTKSSESRDRLNHPPLDDDTVFKSSASSSDTVRTHKSVGSSGLGESKTVDGKPSFEDLRSKKRSPMKLLKRLSAADKVEKDLIKGEKDLGSVIERSQARLAQRRGEVSQSSVLELPRVGTGIPSRPTSRHSSATLSTRATQESTLHTNPSTQSTSSTRDMNTIELSSAVRMTTVQPIVYSLEEGQKKEGVGLEENKGLSVLPEETEIDSIEGPLSNLRRSIMGVESRAPHPPLSNLAASPSRRPFSRSISINSNSFDTSDSPVDDQDGFNMEEVAASLKTFQIPSSSLLSSSSSSGSSSKASTPTSSPPHQRPPLLHHAATAPVPLLSIHATPLPVRGQRERGLSTGGLRPFITPVSVLKKPSPQGQLGSATPGSVPHGRSVSFSDGRKTGKLKDPQVQKIELSWNEKVGDVSGDEAGPEASAGTSMRTHRIQNLLDDLWDDSDSAESDVVHDTPSKISQSSSTLPYRSRSNGLNQDSEIPDLTRLSLAPTSRSFHYNGRKNKPGDATFLTECSFGATRDRLVEIITDVHSFVSHWDEMTSIDIEGKQAGSVARMKEFLPKLLEANLNRNDLTYLTGVPSSVETLRAAHNQLSSLTAVAHLMNLQYLDLSYNQLDSVHQLTCLRHLREIKLDHNNISDLTPLFAIDNLINISAAKNQLSLITFPSSTWSRLESLDLGRNRIESIFGLESLSSLRSLILDGNKLRTLEPSGQIRKLRSLKVSDNKLTQLDIGQFPQLRILYADDNRLKRINRSARSTKLERLSLRNQEGSHLSLSAVELKEVKRLFVSNNPITPSFFNQRCPNLIYLEMASCMLSALPDGFSSFVPNIRNLNLNYNFLSDLVPLRGLQSLTKLSVVKSRLDATKPVVRVVRTLPNLQMLDIRMNPCTLALYLPIMTEALSVGSETNTGLPSLSTSIERTSPESAGCSPSWAELDTAFRRSLPDDWYVRRLAHRGLIMQTCPRVSTLDGVIISDGERAKANELFETIRRKSES
ncbi:Protein phosphatase 1, regulatory subunit, and related proteins [Phaffia rhodozyma]|uniref:Protein phosphatase 1, regulatory subunit, and related proteins n=1 Tax=Phaffia rhodozyma TaxID=264483 RepID=A0A0F7SHQ3_PHARH|nr:Protein phosphatase 1, regulatory subunit, and related proteins [Phaffia rhodozyma]